MDHPPAIPRTSPSVQELAFRSELLPWCPSHGHCMSGDSDADLSLIHAKSKELNLIRPQHLLRGSGLAVQNAWDLNNAWGTGDIGTGRRTN
ncbi:hypothetical protein CISG_09456 [Coccidioides immitis RMSCC 3703]|uniref:Uncharacterized protein n=1 Tax=Coccidioides immitis RMSCC 3703 TaxID=454286 RepID=A0A0J8QMR4_COCIT|nr:hypothetical protein CISG_09456 [Coccidioides immitis RMSCC 3703]